MQELNFDEPFNYESEIIPEIVEELIEDISEKPKKSKNRKTTRNYINNNDFYEALVKYKKDCIFASINNEPKPQIPNYIGECFIKLSEGLARRPNFFGYSYRDEMISDGIENCLSYMENFDPEKTKNPFAYFTQILWWCFVRRIKKEKTQQYIKYKCTENFGILDESELDELNSNKHTKQLQVYDNMYEFMEKYEEFENDKKQSYTKNNIKSIELTGIELFL